jgi:hypothetical protein
MRVLSSWHQGSLRAGHLHCELIITYLGEKVKVKQSRYRPGVAQRVGRSTCITLLFHDLGTRRRWGVSVTPRPLFILGKDPVPIVQEAGWPQGRSRQVRMISPPPGFDPRTVQPVASRYTDYATRPARILEAIGLETKRKIWLVYCVALQYSDNFEAEENLFPWRRRLVVSFLSTDWQK